MFAFLLSDVTSIGFAKTFAFESEANTCNCAIILSGSPMKKPPPGTKEAVADPIPAPSTVSPVPSA